MLLRTTRSVVGIIKPHAAFMTLAVHQKGLHCPLRCDELLNAAAMGTRLYSHDKQRYRLTHYSDQHGKNHSKEAEEHHQATKHKHRDELAPAFENEDEEGRVRKEGEGEGEEGEGGLFSHFNAILDFQCLPVGTAESSMRYGS